VKTLYILRHGKAEKEASDDFHRVLAPRGQRDADAVGRWLKSRLAPDSPGLVSAAWRTRETAERVAAESGWNLPEPLMAGYLASDWFWMQGVMAWRHAANSGIVVGHNPGVSGLIDSLSGQTDWLPTCGLVAIQFQVDTWNLISRGTGTVVERWTPKDLS
jgi:phosphohistidine phosphatase